MRRLNLFMLAVFAAMHIATAAELRYLGLDHTFIKTDDDRRELIAEFNAYSIHFKVKARLEDRALAVRLSDVAPELTAVVTFWDYAVTDNSGSSRFFSMDEFRLYIKDEMIPLKSVAFELPEAFAQSEEARRALSMSARFRTDFERTVSPQDRNHMDLEGVALALAEPQHAGPPGKITSAGFNDKLLVAKTVPGTNAAESKKMQRDWEKEKMLRWTGVSLIGVGVICVITGLVQNSNAARAGDNMDKAKTLRAYKLSEIATESDPLRKAELEDEARQQKVNYDSQANQYNRYNDRAGIFFSLGAGFALAGAVTFYF